MIISMYTHIINNYLTESATSPKQTISLLFLSSFWAGS